MNASLPKRTSPRVDFFKKALMGLIIGIASITPGLSGGVIAAATGLYEPSVRAIVDIRKQFKKSVLYLLPIGLGVGIGVLLFSKVMERLMAGAPFAVLYAFLGLVLGSIPALLDEANSKGFRARYLWSALCALAVVIFIEQIIAAMPSQSGSMELTAINTILCGAIFAFGTIVPGISSSFIFIYLGVYEKLLSAATSLDIGVLWLFALGFGATCLLIIKLVEVVFRRFHGFAYYAVIGFLVGSMVAIFPGLRAGWMLAADVLLLLVCAAIGFAGMRLSKKA